MLERVKQCRGSEHDVLIVPCFDLNDTGKSSETRSLTCHHSFFDSPFSSKAGHTHQNFSFLRGIIGTGALFLWNKPGNLETYCLAFSLFSYACSVYPGYAKETLTQIRIVTNLSHFMVVKSHPLGLTIHSSSNLNSFLKNHSLPWIFRRFIFGGSQVM